MAVTAKVSSNELDAQVRSRFVGKYAEGVLIEAPGVEYQPGTTNDATFVSFEVPIGTGGYDRQIIRYDSGDVSQYTDDGIALQTKGTVFAHDGGPDSIDFTHVALLWSTGNAITVSVPTDDPVEGNAGVYTDLPTFTAGNGTGLTLDLEVSNNIFVFTVSRPGRNYAENEEIQVLESTLEAVGAIPSGQNLGGATMIIDSVSVNTDAGNVVTVAKPTNPVILTAGNEAAFYWNVKLYGFNDVDNA
jgi:hypothetical protein